MGADLHKNKLIVELLKTYNIENKDNLEVINKDIFYLIVIIIGLRSNHLEYLPEINLSDEDKIIIEKLKDKINLYIKIFTPTTDFRNSYKRNNLNDLPKEIRKLIAVENIKQDLANYSISLSYIEYFSNEIVNHLFNGLEKERLQAQNDLEKGPHLYELVLFSSILTTLRDHTNMLNMRTIDNMNKDKKNINQRIFRKSFLPAFNKAKLQNREIASMNSAKRIEVYEIAKRYGNGALSQKQKESTITKHDFTAIFEQASLNYLEAPLGEDNKIKY